MRQACMHRALVYVLFEPNGYRIPEFQKTLKVGKFGVVVLPRLVRGEPIKARPEKSAKNSVAQSVGQKIGVNLLGPSRLGVVVLPRLIWVEPIKARPGQSYDSFLRTGSGSTIWR